MYALSFVILSTTDWDAPQFGSRQQIARELAHRGHRVLFVEVPRAPHSLISDLAGTRRALRRLGRVRQVEAGLLAYTPWPVLPIYYHPLTNAINQRLLERDLRRVLKRLGWRPDVLWTYWPNTAPLLGRLDERAAVYHCIDDFAAAGYPLVTPNTIVRMEAMLCRHVDLVFVRTEALATARRRLNPETHLLLGGVDATLFDPDGLREAPHGVAALSRPRVGLVGTLDDRVDVALLVECARQVPEAQFALVGPVKRHRVDLRALEVLPNVHQFPPCPHDDVPAIIAALDVCLIPYRVNAYAQGLSPIKLYEYLAMGKPVVATDLPYLRREAALVRIAATPQAFVAALREALARPLTAEERARRRRAAEEHSWQRQVDRIEGHLVRVLEAQ